MKTLLCSLWAACLVSQSLAAIEGGVCSSNSDCSGTKGANCRITNPCKTGTCVCPQGQTSLATGGSQCQNFATPATSTYNPTKLGASCSVDTDCTGYITGATCQSSKCACQASLAAAQDGINCQPFNNGDKCSSSTSGVCGASGNGDCSSGKCACFSGYTWVTSGQIGQPGGCVSSTGTYNLGQAQPCTASINWASTSLKLCSANLMCGMCPEGGNYCFSGAASLTVAMVTIFLAAVCSLLMSRL